MEKKQSLSIIADQLTENDLDHDVLFFEPFKSCTIRVASQLLITECKSDSHKRDVFKHNMTELFRKHCESLYNPYQKIAPNTALLERITLEVLSDTEARSYADLNNRFPGFKITQEYKRAHVTWSKEDSQILPGIKFVERWYKDYPNMIEKELVEVTKSRCYTVIHVASYVLDEEEIKKIQQIIPFSSRDKDLKKQFLECEILLLRLMKVTTSTNSSRYNRTLFECRGSFKQLIADYNNGFGRMDKVGNSKTLQSAIQSAEILIQSYWILLSKLALEQSAMCWGDFELLEYINTDKILKFMIQFWVKYPTRSTNLHQRKFLHQMIVKFLLSVRQKTDSNVVNCLIQQQRMAQNGLIPKAFALYHVLKYGGFNVVDQILKFSDANAFPSSIRTFNVLGTITDVEQTPIIPIEQFDFMWGNIMYCIHNTNMNTIKKIIMRAITADIENQIAEEFNRIAQISDQHLVKCASLEYYQKLKDTMQRRNDQNAASPEANNDGFRLIANLQSQSFNQFVNLSPKEAESCFKVIIDLLIEVPMLENSRTPYEVMILCFQNACLQRNLELRNYIAENLVLILHGLNNLHAMNHVLILISKVLRSQSSEDLIKKNKIKKDPLIVGIKEVMLAIEDKLEAFRFEEFDVLDSHFQPCQNGLQSILDHYCQIHLTCLSILTFCDLTHVVPPMKTWFESLSNIMLKCSKLERRGIQCIKGVYVKLLSNQILRSSTKLQLPRGALLEAIRNKTPYFLMLIEDEKLGVSEKNTVLLEMCQRRIQDVFEQNTSLISSSKLPVSFYLIERLNNIFERGLLIPHFVNSILTHFNVSDVQIYSIQQLLNILKLSWTNPVQHEDMEYVTNVTENPKLLINMYFQFKPRAELDGSERITITVGNLILRLKCFIDLNVLRCVYSTNNGDKFICYLKPASEVHSIMLQFSNDGDEVFLITHQKTYKLVNKINARAIDEIKTSICSLDHTIPIVFQGDRQSLYDVHELGIIAKNIDVSRRYVLATKGRKLNIGQMFHTVIQIRYNQSISSKNESKGFESTVEQLRETGGFGFIFYAFTKFLTGNTAKKRYVIHWELLLAYLNSPYLRAERFSRSEAVQMTSLLLRHATHKVPEVIMQKIFDMCMITDSEIKDAVFLSEILSEPSYWGKDLTMFYRLLTRFKSSNPGTNMDKTLPLILKIVAKIIKSDEGTDEVRDIVTVTVEIFKEWCREPHAVRTAQLVTFMMDLFDFEKINPFFEKFRWVDQCCLEREISRQPTLIFNCEDSGEETITQRRINRTLLQLDLPLGDIDDDELFRVPTPTEQLSDRELRKMSGNRDYMMKGLLRILHQAYVLCPDTQYACFDSITAEKICYLIEANNSGKVVGTLIEMYEAILNHNIYSDKIKKIVELDLLSVLARQLRNKPLTMQSVNALFSILLREQVDVSAGLDNAHLETFYPNTVSCRAVYPLLTILEESADDFEVAVFTVVCTSLNKVYTFNNQLTQAMTAAGIDEHMAAILAKLSKLGDFRMRNEKLKALLDPWFAFAISIIRIGVNGKQSVFEGAYRLISHLLLLYTQENGKLLDNPNNEAQRLIRDNINWALCVLLLQLFKFLLDIALADSNKHRSASNSSLRMIGYDEEPEEIEATPVKATKFWDDIAQKVKKSVLGPNQPFLKCPYRKHKESPLTPEEMCHRIKDVLSLCQYFVKISNRIECDEEDNFYRIFFDELSKWTLDEAWPSCIWATADMMFVTNVFATCVAFVLTDIHQYISPFNMVFVRRNTSRMEVLLHRIIRSYTKIPTVFGNLIDIDQMIRLALENITQREDQNCNLFKLAVLFLNCLNREKDRVSVEYPQPCTPDLIQKLTVESEIASRYWLDQRNEVIEKVNLKDNTPQHHFDVSEINLSLERMQKALAAPRNMKRVNEICDLMKKLEENERVFTCLTAIKNDYKLRKITTTLGPRGERMVTDFTDVKNTTEFAENHQLDKITTFPEVFKALSLSSIRKPGIFAALRNACLHGILISNGVQTNPIFHVHNTGISTLPHGSHIVERTILFENMTMIFRRPMRPWDALEVSFEILLDTHETMLIFAQQRFAKLVEQYASKLIAGDHQLVACTKRWEEGKLSNFEYLTFLNLFAGRSIHDSSSYPIFPRILAKFGDGSIDLQDKTIYRKLDQPVAAQDLLSVEKHREHYNELKDNEEVSHLKPYHFGSMCSNRGVVSFYNVRLLPFGEEAIELQDGRFDFPDRLFHSIESGLGLGKIESSNDYKELVPELFTTVEVLKNENGNQFGVRQNGESVNDVEVPQWAFVNGEPYHENFIYLHRQALESEHVQSMLHHWIDLMFGYKSRGKAAHHATNVYHPAVYPGSSPPPGFDRVMTNAYEANQKALGTAPLQLFTQPHPKREVVHHRHGSVRNMHGLAFGKELTIGPYEVGEYTMDKHATQQVWRKMKNLKSIIFNKSSAGDQENIQLFRKNRDKKDKDPADINCKIKGNVLIVSDGATEIFKDHINKIDAVSVDEHYVACVVHQGSIELYKMVYTQSSQSRIAVERVIRGNNKPLSAQYYGTLPVQEGHYIDVEICASFSTIFTIHKIGKNSVVSVWNLHSHHIRSHCTIEANVKSCGVLKNLGEIIVVEKWNGEQTRFIKEWKTKKRDSKKKKYCGKTALEFTVQILAKVSINGKPSVSKYVENNRFIHNGVISMAPEPGMGIQTLAMARSDHCIVLFETMNLTVMRILEVENRIQYCLRELRFQEDNSLIAIFKESPAIRKMNKGLDKILGSAPPTKTWRFKIRA